MARPHPKSGLVGLVLLVAVAGAVACRGPVHAPPGPGEHWHELRAGETLYSVARRYGVPVSVLIDANGIPDVRDVPVGTRLRIPDPNDHDDPWLAPGMDPRDGLGGPPRPGVAPRPSGRALEFAWPLRGRLTSRYGGRRRGQHDGIDLAAPPGTLVRASEAGRVVYSGRLGDYGLMVAVRHDPQFTTIYAHHRKNRVQAGSFVDKGEVLGEVGSSGNATGPHLHFEIRRDRRPLDPMAYLP